MFSLNEWLVHCPILRSSMPAPYVHEVIAVVLESKTRDRLMKTNRTEKQKLEKT